MAVKPLPDLREKISPAVHEKTCLACGLYLNQLPIFDEKIVQSQIFWVGLSAVRFENGEDKLPLAPSTRSGELIETIEIPLRKKYQFYKTNLVKCPPIFDEKIRYPLQKEMEKCYSNFEKELEILKPSFIFLLGGMVSKFVLKKYDIPYYGFAQDFNYSSFKLANGTTLIPIHHPSYILVYKRKLKEEYIKGVRAICNKASRKKVHLI